MTVVAAQHQNNVDADATKPHAHPSYEEDQVEPLLISPPNEEVR
jgi:hypothetical protein